jgi:hypothetical protein
MPKFNGPQSIFLNFQPHPTDLCAFLASAPHCLHHCSFEIGKCEFSLFFLFKVILFITDPLGFHVNFRINLKLSTEESVVKYYNESLYQFEDYFHNILNFIVHERKNSSHLFRSTLIFQQYFVVFRVKFEHC